MKVREAEAAAEEAAAAAAGIGQDVPAPEGVHGGGGDDVNAADAEVAAVSVPLQPQDPNEGASTLFATLIQRGVHAVFTPFRGPGGQEGAEGSSTPGNPKIGACNANSTPI